MARMARIESPTGYYHVMARGNNKEAIFKETSEKEYFIELLRHQIKDNKILLTAYCLMSNHVHLLIYTGLGNMSEALKWINIKFAGRYNFKYERVGHVFQDRFKSEIIDTEGYLIRAIRYIHNNPVKAKIVHAPSAYKWSSYNGFLVREDPLVDTAEKQMVLKLLGSAEQFKRFHLKEDELEFLEVEEDLEKERKARAQNIIGEFQKENGLIEADPLCVEKENLEKLIIELLEKSKLTHRKIAELIGVSRSVVHSVARKI